MNINEPAKTQGEKEHEETDLPANIYDAVLNDYHGNII
jgi:hypothetical protein